MANIFFFRARSRESPIWTDLPPASSSFEVLPPPQLQTPSNFPSFSKLPIEIRLIVWAYVSHFPRVVEVRSWGKTTYGRPHRIVPTKYSVGPHKPPTVLQINHESRTEALRYFTLVKIGISTTELNPRRTYIPWFLHPANPNASRHTIGYRYDPLTGELPFPYSPQKVWINFTNDVIYLGPEFRLEHLEGFLTKGGAYQELTGIQYLAIDRKLWVGAAWGRWDDLRNSLYGLESRPVKQIFIIPDDEKNRLHNKFYYRPHEITLHNPPATYQFQGEPPSGKWKTVVESLDEWFEKWWKGSGTIAPKTSIMSVRRNGEQLGIFKDGAWEIQQFIAQGEQWIVWNPKSE